MLFENFDLLYVIVKDLAFPDVAHLAQVNRASAKIILMMWPYLIRRRYPFLQAPNDRQVIQACQRFYWHAQKLSEFQTHRSSESQYRSQDQYQYQCRYTYQDMLGEGLACSGYWPCVIRRFNLLGVYGDDTLRGLNDARGFARYIALYYFRDNVDLAITYFQVHCQAEWVNYSELQICERFLRTYHKAPPIYDDNHLIAELPKLYRFLDRLFFEHV
jgi:hypothetical protein